MYVYHLKLQRLMQEGNLTGIYANWVMLDIYQNPPTRNDVLNRLIGIRKQYAMGTIENDNINNFILKVVEYGIPTVTDDGLQFTTSWGVGNDRTGYAEITRYEVVENG